MQKQSILISGCSSGIGEAAAFYLQKRGYRVFATARHQADVSRLQQAGLESVLMDVSDDHSIKTAIDTILQRTGGTLSAVFNNAGYLQAGAVEDLSRELDQHQFNVNVFGAMAVIRAVLPIMRAQGYGRIINNSSILGVVTIPYCGSYNASKYALEGYTLSLRQELYGTNIKVSLINPGPIYSKLRTHAHEHYQTTIIQSQTGHHEKAYRDMETHYFSDTSANRNTSLPPEKLIKKLIHALESREPCTHYYIGWVAAIMAFLRRVLPDHLLEWVIRQKNRS